MGLGAPPRQKRPSPPKTAQHRPRYQQPAHGSCRGPARSVAEAAVADTSLGLGADRFTAIPTHTSLRRLTVHSLRSQAHGVRRRWPGVFNDVLVRRDQFLINSLRSARVASWKILENGIRYQRQQRSRLRK